MNLYKIVLVLLAAFISACQTKEVDKKVEVKAETPLLSFSKQQLKNVGIVIGKVETRTLADEVPATGVIDVPPQNLANISTFVQGKVSGINIYPGVQVKKGTVLCYLTHPDILQMQQQYVKARANADLSASELKRQTNLSNEEATSKRKMQMADADFVNNDAEMHALEGKLKLLGIDVNNVKAGNFMSKIPVVASIAGFVKDVLVNEGKTVAANDVLFTIINTDHLHLELKVFERDSYKIKDGQKISFSVRSEPNKFYDAEIYVAAKNLDAANGTVSIHGHFHEEGVNLMPGSYVDAKIKVGNSARATLPEGAILHLGNRHLVFVAKTKGDTVSFEKVDIKVGRIIGGYAEIIDAKDWENQSIVVANPDFLEAQLNNSEEE